VRAHKDRLVRLAGDIAEAIRDAASPEERVRLARLAWDRLGADVIVAPFLDGIEDEVRRRAHAALDRMPTPPPDATLNRVAEPRRIVVVVLLLLALFFAGVPDPAANRGATMLWIVASLVGFLRVPQ
jgi:hypothetical protein